MRRRSPMVDPRRVRRLNSAPDGDGPVIYWMSRDQRARHNWALLYACEKSIEFHRPLEVLFTLAPSFLGAPLRQYDFMLRGLTETCSILRETGIPMSVRFGEPGSTLPAYAAVRRAGAVVTDFSPLRLTRNWKRKAADGLGCALYEVDAHNIVPCWLASPKQEYAARTIRPKLHRLMGEFLTEFPEPEAPFQPSSISLVPVCWNELASALGADASVGPVQWPTPGESAAESRLQRFIGRGLGCYAEGRNDPNADGVSGLSPYLHFGQISAQHAALSVAGSNVAPENRESFIEELFVRRELAENFCFHNPRYDSFDGIPDWAKASLAEHAADLREHLYTPEEFESAVTHDPLWNAAQRSLVLTGAMHGYMRMYWAKKILEWSPTPAAAFDIAIALNDRYALDGRDPNGYTGIAWSIGGVHDRPWFDRPVFGRIRYMNASGCARKFDVRRYIQSMSDSRPLLQQHLRQSHHG